MEVRVESLGSRWEVFASCLIVSGGDEGLEMGWMVWELFEDEAGRECVR